WIDEYQIDLVQSFLYRANTLAGMAARLARRTPIVVAGQRSLYPLGGRRAALAARWTRGLAHQVVAVSAAVRTQLVEVEGVAPGRIVVIENGVDTTRYTVATTCNREAFGLRPNALAIGGVGRLSEEKGFDHLLEGVALARQSGLPITVLLAGDGPARSRL